MSKVVVGALSRVVAQRTTRRGLLARIGLGATALAVAPITFAVRPVSAHRVICSCADRRCRCGDACCDGFTDFCCKLTGENRCPPNTVVAGWWQANGSGFCDVGESPRPRYFLDCNHICPDGCGCNSSGICAPSCTSANCRCLDGCNSRSVDCAEFRYGQCSPDIACVGPIACRVVTCVPPWQWDETCANIPATDNTTAFHDRPCLHDGFTDLAPNAYYLEPIQWAVAQGIATGYNEDIFGPNEPILRWHVAVFLWRASGKPKPASSANFKDRNEDWYWEAIDWLTNEGIVSGTSDGRFQPEAVVTRGQAVLMLWRLQGQSNLEFEWAYPFDDVPASAHYYHAAQWAHQNDITYGVAERKFAGELEIDRAQFLTFLYRFKMQEEDPPTSKPQDSVETLV